MSFPLPPYCWFFDLEGCNPKPDIVEEPSLHNSVKPHAHYLSFVFGGLDCKYNLDKLVCYLVAAITGAVTGWLVVRLLEYLRYRLFRGQSQWTQDVAPEFTLEEADRLNNNIIPLPFPTNNNHHHIVDSINEEILEYSDDDERNLSVHSFNEDERTTVTTELFQPGDMYQTPRPHEEAFVTTLPTRDYEIQDQIHQTPINNFGSYPAQLLPVQTQKVEWRQRPKFRENKLQKTIKANNYSTEFSGSTSKVSTNHIQQNHLENAMLEFHQYPRGRLIPCENPIGMKIECLLRILQIPYQIEFDCQLERNDSPWLLYHSRISNLNVNPRYYYYYSHNQANYSISDFFCEHFPQSCKFFFTKDKIAEHYLNCVAEFHLLPVIEKIIEKIIEKQANSKNPAYSNSDNQQARTKEFYFTISMSTPNLIEYMNENELRNVLNDDIISLSAALGNKSYFLGEIASEIDCTIFSILCYLQSGQIPYSIYSFLYRFPNLVNYYARMKSMLWPDWDSIVITYQEEERTQEVNR